MPDHAWPFIIIATGLVAAPTAFYAVVGWVTLSDRRKRQRGAKGK